MTVVSVVVSVEVPGNFPCLHWQRVLSPLFVCLPSPFCDIHQTVTHCLKNLTARLASFFSLPLSPFSPQVALDKAFPLVEHYCWTHQSHQDARHCVTVSQLASRLLLPCLIGEITAYLSLPVRQLCE